MPPVQALPTHEVGTEYYDECMNLQYSHIITCDGSVFIWGSQAGAKYKNHYRLKCDGPGYDSYWYEWNGSSWVLLPSIPVPGC